MFRWALIVVLIISILGTVIWGYQEHQEKNAILIQAENNYQRAFHDLTYRVDLINSKINNAIAMNSPQKLSPELTDIWKVSAEAHADVSQLPLTLLPFNNTESFLKNIGDFAYRVAIRDLNDEPLSDDEIETLSSLYEQSSEVKRDLRTVQHQVLNDGLRWMDVELALANDEPRDHAIIDGLTTVEKNAEGYDVFNEQSGLTIEPEEKGDVQLPGSKQDENDIQQIVMEYFELDEEQEYTITHTGEGSDIPIYNVSFDQENSHGYVEVTEQGGHVLSYLKNRELNEQQLSLHESREEAEKMIADLGFDDVTVVNSQQFEKVGVFEFVRTEDEIHFFPDRLQIKVALDNGEILGLTARDYLINKNKDQDREFEVEITEEELDSFLHPNLKKEEVTLAVIEGDLGEEVLCYQVIGTMNDSTYRVYISAEDGYEERVEQLKQSEEVYS
ncbi:germination protein YpeB [Halalkalibacillus halophilus]|uniref:germination protein YpeB n=1 Tax=Halalkalibacillus halophilus TaxID=392827 RepID=UPI0003FE9D63|nr:germination protein YpeB [Halalkalibacillus halophilus]